MRQLVTAHPFQIVTWNVNFRRASVLEALTKLHRVPDILTLQEVSVEQSEAFRERLLEMGLEYVFYSGRADGLEKCYGNIIASRWTVGPVDGGTTPASFPWPQLVAHVVIKVGGSPVNVITAHIPNGAGNGWAKIDTYRALARLVRSVQGEHCILTGDFNEPQFARQGGRIVTFGQEQLANGYYQCWNHWSFQGRTGKGEEWDAAVRWFFEAGNDQGLRLAFWEATSPGTMEPTHISRGNPRWFDHIFISKQLRVESCRYLHETRLHRYSDHSALAAELAIFLTNKGMLTDP
jgi:endonuclease/exonuclease/phosphatase family metal-dependent hydrolase